MEEFKKAVVEYFNGNRSDNTNLKKLFADAKQTDEAPYHARVFDNLPNEAIPAIIQEHIKKLPDALRADINERGKISWDSAENSRRNWRKNFPPKKTFPNYLAWKAKLEALSAQFLLKEDLSFQDWVVDIVGNENYEAAVKTDGKQTLGRVLVQAFGIPTGGLIQDACVGSEDIYNDLPVALTCDSTSKPNHVTTEDLIKEGRAILAEERKADLNSDDHETVLTTYLKYGMNPEENPDGHFYQTKIEENPAKNAARFINDALDNDLKVLPQNIIEHLKTLNDIITHEIQKNNISLDNPENEDYEKINQKNFPKTVEWRSKLNRLICDTFFDENLQLNETFINAMTRVAYNKASNVMKVQSLEGAISNSLMLFCQQVPQEADIENEPPGQKITRINFIGTAINLAAKDLPDLRKERLSEQLRKDIRVFSRKLTGEHIPEGITMVADAKQKLIEMRERLSDIHTAHEVASNPDEGWTAAGDADVQIKQLQQEHRNFVRGYEVKRKAVIMMEATKNMQSEITHKAENLNNQISNMIKEGASPTKIQAQTTKLNTLKQTLKDLDKIHSDAKAAHDVIDDNYEKGLDHYNHALYNAETAYQKVEKTSQQHRGLLTWLADLFKELFDTLRGKVSTLGVMKDIVVSQSRYMFSALGMQAPKPDEEIEKPVHHADAPALDEDDEENKGKQEAP